MESTTTEPPQNQKCPPGVNQLYTRLITFLITFNFHALHLAHNYDKLGKLNVYSETDGHLTTVTTSALSTVLRTDHAALCWEHYPLLVQRQGAFCGSFPSPKCLLQCSEAENWPDKGTVESYRVTLSKSWCITLGATLKNVISQYFLA